MSSEPAHEEDIVETAGYVPTSPIRSREAYEEQYRRSIEDPGGFWGEIAKQFHWEQPWDAANACKWNFDMDSGPVSIEWFKGGKTNLAFNALDRQIAQGRGDKTCFIWEGNDVGQESKLTYSEVKDQVCKLANYFKSVGVKKGDRVCMYLPMLCELPISMLACARIGAVHSVVFGGFSAEALAQRIIAAESKVVLTTTAVNRGAKPVGLKSIVDEAIKICETHGGFRPTVVVTYENVNAMPRGKANFVEGRDVWWQEAVAPMSAECAVEWLDAEDPAFLLYTSGSTGQPKGVLHTTGGYMVWAATTFKYVFDYRDDDVYWCTADCGWITGHTYLAYGPLLNGATALVFEGVPTYPDGGRFWDVVDKHGVTLFYTAPTAIRSLQRLGDHFVTGKSLKTLRVLGTVGEPINPEAWHWYYNMVGRGRCPIVDTWWQTETGGHMITPLPGAWAVKPGSATLPFFGVQPAILDAEGNELPGAAEGILVLKTSWPGGARSLFGDHERFESTYFSAFKGYYFTGDGARRDKDGFYWITGRVDDVINVSGHRIGTAEVESALVLHADCAEAAVVGVEHPIKGQCVYAYVSLMEGAEYSEEVRKALVEKVRAQIGPFASPDVIHWAPGLPKTRSGKIMRRILRKIANNELDALGDTSTLADPSVVDTLISLKGK